MVTSTRTERRADDVTVPTEVINRREIEATKAVDLGELLEAHPGIELTSSFNGTGLRLQGLGPAYALILIDGERIAGRVNLTIDLSRINLRDVERVEIVKGPASVLYGSDAIGGVVNIITRVPNRSLEADGRASYGLPGALDLEGRGGGKLGNFSGALSGAYLTRAAYDWDPSTASVTVPATSNWQGDGRARYAVGPVSVLGSVGYQRRELSAVDATDSGAVFDRRNRTESFDATLHSQLAAGADTQVLLRGHFSLYRDQLQLDQRRARDLDSYADARDRVGELGAQVTRTLFAGNQLTGGVEGLWESQSSPRLVDGKGTRQRLGVFLHDEYRVLPEPRLNLDAGLRLDVDSQFGLAPSPRLAVRFDPISQLTFRASYGWGFRAPSFQETSIQFFNPGVGYLVDGNPALRPEQSWGANLWVELRPSDAVGLEFSLFRTDLDNLITVVTDSSVPDQIRYTYGNVSKARSQGLEAGARLRLLTGVTLDLAYAFTDARDLGTGLPIEGQAIHRATAQLNARFRPWGLSGLARAAITGPRPFLVGTGLIYSPTFTQLDVTVTKELWSFLSVFVAGKNLLDQGHELFDPVPPRSVHLGVEGRY